MSHVIIHSYLQWDHFFSTRTKVPSQSFVNLKIGRLTERETKENEGQGERVAECEATVARQGFVDVHDDAYDKWEERF